MDIFCSKMKKTDIKLKWQNTLELCYESYCKNYNQENFINVKEIAFENVNIFIENILSKASNFIEIPKPIIGYTDDGEIDLEWCFSENILLCTFSDADECEYAFSYKNLVKAGQKIINTKNDILPSDINEFFRKM